jgi:hypothetical protein
MKTLLLVVGLGFGLMMAYIIGERMSIDAMAVVLGVAVGIVASIPTTLLLVALVRRSRQDSYEAPRPPQQQLPYQPPPPQIIIYDPWAHHNYRESHYDPRYDPRYEWDERTWNGRGQ